jgi:hypothetical protein
VELPPTTPTPTPTPTLRPIVVLLDLDGTVVGEVDGLVHERELLSRLGLPASSALLQADLGGGRIVRPGFAQFIKEVKAAHANVEFFVYTASSPDWARVLVPHIEAACGVRLNRPIISRDQCLFHRDTLQCRKSLSVIDELLTAALRPRYPQLGSVREDAQAIVLIDNTEGVLLESRNQVTVPTYVCRPRLNMLRQIPSSRIEAANILLRHGMPDAAAWQEQHGARSYPGRARATSPMAMTDCVWSALKYALSSPRVASMDSAQLARSLSNAVCALCPARLFGGGS